jgi:hypothetical protein
MTRLAISYSVLNIEPLTNLLKKFGTSAIDLTHLELVAQPLVELDAARGVGGGAEGPFRIRAG